MENIIKTLDAARESLSELIDVAKQHYDDCGGCDHSVGICCCDLEIKIYNATKAHNALATHLRHIHGQPVHIPKLP